MTRLSKGICIISAGKEGPLKYFCHLFSSAPLHHANRAASIQKACYNGKLFQRCVVLPSSVVQPDPMQPMGIVIQVSEEPQLLTPPNFRQSKWTVQLLPFKLLHGFFYIYMRGHFVLRKYNAP